jgi:acetyl esterase/lipase
MHPNGVRVGCATLTLSSPFFLHGRHMNPRRLLFAPLLALVTLLSSGCERVFFAYVNRGVPSPDSSVMYAPDRALSLDIYRPRGLSTSASTAPVPVVVFFYGGAWKMGNRHQYRFVGERLANNGILTIVADYRTYPVAGFPAFMDDAADAVAWAHAHASEYGGDPQRLFIAGHSAGAQIAALLATDATYLAKRDMQPKQLAGVIGLSGPYDFNVGKTYAPIFGPPSQWPKAQAVNYVNGDEPPFLLIQGLDDHTVAPRNTTELATRLLAVNVPVTVALLPGAGHTTTLAGLYAPERAPEVLPAILAFVQGRSH